MARPASFGEAVAFAATIAGKATATAGVEISAWTSVGSEGAGTIVWTAAFDTLVDWEAAGDKLGGDADYVSAVQAADGLFTGTVDDGLLNIVAGLGGDPAANTYVGIVRATCAGGKLGAGMAQGVAIAEAATRVGGLNTVFGSEVTGAYGGVRWLTGAPNIAALEAASNAIAGSQEFVELVDGGGGLYLPDAQQAMFRRIA
ncbi:MAG: hypothetical protein Q7V88_07360 [Actinomycetota bacterium]|nr:hypothetical protein [Actinomycetota bacterium]